jgi:N-acetylmuramoyl-L-alanine amidase
LSSRTWSPSRRSAGAPWTLALVAAAALLVPPLAAQRTDQLALLGPRGASGAPIPIGFHRGYAAVPLGSLTRVGWTVERTAGGGQARRADEEIEVFERSPFFRWTGAVLQLTAEPYRYGEDLWVPLQLLSDFLPERRAEEYAFRGEGLALEVKLVTAWTPEGQPRLEREPAAPAPTPPPTPNTWPPGSEPARAPAAPRGADAASRGTGAPAPARRSRVVVIDPGHGGEDSGARGPRGVREKEVALRVALALARRLERHPDIEVHLTRTQDRLVPLWERGEWATSVKGERPAVFVSLHANSGSIISARGFETYFLSEARTEHERRVAALENASFREGADVATGDPELEGIVKELRSLDHQHWSSLLAEMVQDEMARVHPGPNRGVKQGPLAVITNSLMPSVLIELGFISNRDEERLLASAEFHADAARALEQAIERFFERYPPGGGAPGGGPR